MKLIFTIVTVALLSGCLAPREASAPLPSRACPSLPLLADNPTSTQYRIWAQTVIPMYVQCAKGQKL